jgi:hypothetical protein
MKRRYAKAEEENSYSLMTELPGVLEPRNKIEILFRITVARPEYVSMRRNPA